jgi:hypothetical protein
MKTPYAALSPVGFRTRVSLALLTVAAVLYPLLHFRLAGHSVFMTFWEFACYRYYGGLSNLAGDLQSLWIVQGFPMALGQNLQLLAFQHFWPTGLGSVAQIDVFAWITLALAYLLIAPVLGWAWLRSRGAQLDLLVVSLMTIAMWPLTRYYPYLLASNYWINEVPLYLISCLWAVRRREVLGEDAAQRLPLLALAVIGALMGLAFLQKPSLVAFAALPAVVELSFARQSWFRRALTVVLIGLAAAASHWLVFHAYYHFAPGHAANAYRQYWNWLIHHPETGTSLLTYPQLLQAANFLFVPVVLGLLAFVGMTLFCAGSKTQRSTSNFLVLAFLALGFLGHAAVIAKRPSGTSVVDAMFYGTFIIPVLFALLPGALKKHAAVGLAAVVVLASVAYRPVLFGRPAGQPAGEILTAIGQVRETVAAIGRPVILLLPDNRIHLHTAEGFGLYTGQLNLKPNVYDARGLPTRFPADTLRGRLFPHAFILNIDEQERLARAIDAGFVIMWGEAINAPVIGDYFPAVPPLVDNPAFAHKVFPILPGGVVKTHLAYRQDVPAPVLATPPAAANP